MCCSPLKALTGHVGTRNSSEHLTLLSLKHSDLLEAETGGTPERANVNQGQAPAAAARNGSGPPTADDVPADQHYRPMNGSFAAQPEFSQLAAIHELFRVSEEEGWEMLRVLSAL